jgi:hypothetical protein
VVLRQCSPPEFLVECAVWTELVVLVEWGGTNMASHRLDRGILHWCMGLLSPRHRIPVKETFVDFTRVRNWPWCTTMVSNALGNNVYRNELALG